LNPVKEIIVIGEKGNELEREVWRGFLPNKIVVPVDENNEESIPLFQDRKMIGKKTTAYVCENFVCQKPITTLEEFIKAIS